MPALLRQPIDGVFFTGSSRQVGVAETAAYRVIHVRLGSAARTPSTSPTVRRRRHRRREPRRRQAFYNNGQAAARSSASRCTRTSTMRSSTPSSRRRHFVMGDPYRRGGPTSGRSHAPAGRGLEGQVADAVEKGAVVATGGRRIDRPGTGSSRRTHRGVPRHGGDPRRTSARSSASTASRTIQGHGARERHRVRTSPRSLPRDKVRARRVCSSASTRAPAYSKLLRPIGRPAAPWSGRGHSGVGSRCRRRGCLTSVRRRPSHLRRRSARSLRRGRVQPGGLGAVAAGIDRRTRITLAHGDEPDPRGSEPEVPADAVGRAPWRGRSSSGRSRRRIRRPSSPRRTARRPSPRLGGLVLVGLLVLRHVGRARR